MGNREMINFLPSQTILLNATRGNISIGTGTGKLRITGGMTNAEIELAAKNLCDPLYVSEGRHFYFHIYTRSPLSAQLWLGPIGTEPGENWWLPSE